MPSTPTPARTKTTPYQDELCNAGTSAIASASRLAPAVVKEDKTITSRNDRLPIRGQTIAPSASPPPEAMTNTFKLPELPA